MHHGEGCDCIHREPQDFGFVKDSSLYELGIMGPSALLTVQQLFSDIASLLILNGCHPK